MSWPVEGVIGEDVAARSAFEATGPRRAPLDGTIDFPACLAQYACRAHGDHGAAECLHRLGLCAKGAL